MKENIVLCTVALVLAGCSAHKPILYPNDHYRQVGEETAESDIKACMALAEEGGASPGTGKTAETATNTDGRWGRRLCGRCGRWSDFRKRGIRGDGGRSEWRGRRFSPRPVQQLSTERGLYELCGSLLARTWLRSDRLGITHLPRAIIPSLSTTSAE